MHLVPVDLIHQNVLQEKFQNLQLNISEYSFSNIYLFRHIHHYKLFYHDDLFILGETRDGSTYLMPTFPLNNVKTGVVKQWLSEVDFLFPIPEQWISHFDPDHFSCTFLESDSDYLIEREKMAAYSGRHLSGKRNLVKQFLEEYPDVHHVPLTPENLSDAMVILDTWQKEQSLPEIQTDYSSCKEALQLMQALQLTGMIFYIDSHPCAFLIGEKLSDGKTYAIHFSKAEKSIKGLYQFIFQEFALFLEEKYEFINLEQDLGVPQVRQAKHSFQPDLMVNKWRVALKVPLP